ncbi:MAG: hypothetical protein ACO1OQ_05105 [Rufibacter sp.]
MRFRFSVLRQLLLGLILFVLAACGRTTEEESDATALTTAENKVEQEFAQLKDWVNEKANHVDSTAQEKWPSVKAEFKERSAKLESRLDSLSAKSKEEYKELKFKIENWDTRNELRHQVPLHAETLQRFKAELLGSANALDTIWSATAVSDIYSHFVQNVRNRRTTWTAADWDYADEIYQQMNQKKDAVEREIPAKDKLKIKALQAEYLTLETGRDAKDLFKAVK